MICHVTIEHVFTRLLSNIPTYVSIYTRQHGQAGVVSAGKSTIIIAHDLMHSRTRPRYQRSFSQTHIDTYCRYAKSLSSCWFLPTIPDGFFTPFSNGISFVCHAQQVESCQTGPDPWGRKPAARNPGASQLQRNVMRESSQVWRVRMSRTKERDGTALGYLL